MKRIIAVICSLILLLWAMAVCASADNLIEASRYYTFTETGVGFIIPEGWVQVPTEIDNIDAQFLSLHDENGVILFSVHDLLGELSIKEQFLAPKRYQLDNSATSTEEIESFYKNNRTSSAIDYVKVTETRIGHVDYYEIQMSLRSNDAEAHSITYLRIFYGWCYMFTYMNETPINTSPGHGDFIKLVSDSSYPYPDTAIKQEIATRAPSTTEIPATDTSPAETTAPVTAPSDEPKTSENSFSASNLLFGILITAAVLGISFAVYLIITRKRSHLSEQEIQRYKNRTEILFFLRSCKGLTNEDHVVLDSFEHISNELLTVRNSSSRQNNQRACMLENELRTLTSGMRFTGILKRSQYSKRYVTDIESALFSSVYLVRGSEEQREADLAERTYTPPSPSFIPEIKSEDFHPRNEKTPIQEESAVPEGNEPLWCRKCGQKINSDSEFCHKCGTKVIR